MNMNFGGSSWDGLMGKVIIIATVLFAVAVIYSFAAITGNNTNIAQACGYINSQTGYSCIAGADEAKIFYRDGTRTATGSWNLNGNPITGLSGLTTANGAAIQNAGGTAVITLSAGAANVTTGALQVGGVPVLTETGTQTMQNKTVSGPLTFADSAANPDANGELQRNGANLLYNDGTGAFDTLLAAMPGGATAYVVASDAPAALIQAATQAKRIYGSLIQLADGTNDETEIQAAINALPAATGVSLPNTGGDVYFSPGTFTKGVAAAITLPDNVRLHLTNGTMVKLASSINADASIFANADATNGNRGVSIEGGYLDGNERNQTTGVMYGVIFTNCSACAIHSFIQFVRTADISQRGNTTCECQNLFYSPAYNKPLTIASLESTSELTTNCCQGTASTITDRAEGTGAIQVAFASGSLAREVGETFSQAIDLRGKYFTFWLKVDNKSRVQYATLEFFSSSSAPGSGGSFTCGFTQPVEDAMANDTWTKVMCLPSKATKQSGAQDWGWSRITSFKFTVGSNSGGALTIAIDGLQAQPLPQQASATWTFDDGDSGWNTLMAPALNKYGQQGTAFLYVESPSFGPSDALTLQNQFDWDIGCHSLTHPADMSLETDAVQWEELLACRLYFQQNGLSRGAKFFAYPNSLFSNATVTKTQQAYTVWRNQITQAVSMVDNPPMNVNSLSSTTTLADVTGWINAAQKYHEPFVFIGHGVVASGATGEKVNVTDLATWANFLRNTAGIPVKRLSDVYPANEYPDRDWQAVLQAQSYAYVTSNYTARVIDSTIGVSGSGVTVTLPTDDVTYFSGRNVSVVDQSGNASGDNITIATQGAEKINGADTYTISADYGAVTLYNDGSNWFTK